MGAAASTQLATEFFEENRRGCPPLIHLDMNMDTKKVTDEGVKLMPGGALIVPSMECPLHQIGDGKGVSGKLRTVDSSKHRSPERNKLIPSNRFINQKSRTQKAPEEKPLVKSVKDASDYPGHAPTLATSEVELNPALKPLFIIEQEAKPQELFKTPSPSPENSFIGNKSVASECPLKQESQIQSIPLLENYTITPMIAEANPSVMNQVNAPFLKEDCVPLGNEAGKKAKDFPKESPLNQEINNTPIFKDMGKDNVVHTVELISEQPFMLPCQDSVTSNIPPAAINDIWTEPAKQAFYSSMLRKGWIFKETDMTSENMKNMMKIHKANHELAWREVLKWEALHADECKEPKLKNCSGFGTKYSPIAKIRSLLGYSLPFDRHDWIIDRNGKEVRYIIDYYDGGKFNDNFEFALINVRPALDSFEAVWDRLSVAIWRLTSGSNNSGAPGSSTVSVTTSVSEPLNIGERFGGKPTGTVKGPHPSQFMSYNLSDVEKEREKKNSVS